MPLIADNGLMGLNLQQDACSIIKDMFGSHWISSKIDAIFEASHFTCGNFHYQTVRSDDMTVIAGDNARTLGALKSIAHELGHCLAEQREYQPSFDNAHYSETRAYFLEFAITRIYLNRVLNCQEQVQRFERYWQTLCNLSCYYAFEEVQQFFSRPSPLTGLIPEKWHIFRESYIYLPFYQLVYACAGFSHAKLSTPDSIEELYEIIEVVFPKDSFST